MNFTEATETIINLINNLQQLAENSLHEQCTEQLTVLCTVRAVPVLWEMKHDGLTLTLTLTLSFITHLRLLAE